VRSTILCLAAIAMGLVGFPRGAQAEEFTSLDTWDLSGDLSGEPCACESAAPLPPPPFGGCCHERSKLTGDWCGHRTCWAERGITFDLDHTYFYYGVASGGLDQEFDFAGHGDYVFNFDLGKLAGRQGLFLKLRAEHRFGNDVNDIDGVPLPATILTSLPNPNQEDLYLTNVLFTQFLSERFAVFAGKLDTLDGDMNAFAHARGKDQFSNVAFVVNPIGFRTVPYATLGAGFVILDGHEPLFQLAVLNAVDSTGTSGFEELFDEGVTLSAQLRLPTSFWDLPGHQLFGGTWSSRNYVSLGQDPRIILPDVPIDEQDGSLSLFWNCDQYLSLYSDVPTAGWGVFGRAGIADDQTNPLAYFLSAGIGGNSPFYGREADRIGAGYYYAGTSEEIGPILTTVLGPIGDGQGVELFYNYQVTPWFHLTTDLQVLDSARENVDTALIAGLRGRVDF
jgi:porin